MQQNSTTTHVDYVIYTNAIFVIIKKLLVDELKWHIHRFESCIVLGYQVENLEAQWATRDFKKLSDPKYINPFLEVVEACIQLYLLLCCFPRATLSKSIEIYLKLVFTTKNRNASTICHLFSRCRYSHNHCVENASFFETECFCGS